MTRFLAAIVVLLLLLLGALPAVAQETLSLATALARARTTNPHIQAAAADREAAAARIDVARAARLPQIDVIDEWQRGNSPLFFFSSLLGARTVTPADLDTARLNDPEPLSAFRTGILIRQSIFDGGTRARAIDTARLAHETAAITESNRSRDVLLDVVKAYAAVLASEQITRAARSAVETARSDHERVQARRDSGLATDADVLALVVKIAETQADLARAEADTDIARLALNRLMGVPLDAVYTLQEPAALVEAAVAGSPAPPTDAHPTVRAATLRAAIAREERRSAASAFFPQLNVVGGYMWEGLTFGDRRRSWSVGTELRWNLFAGGATGARLRETTAVATSAGHQLTAATAAAQEGIRAAHRLHEAARARDEVGRTAAAAAREAERVTRERYLAGLMTITDLLRATTATFDAESRAAAARLDVIVSRALVQHAQGEIPRTP